MSFKYNVCGSVGIGNILESILKNRGIENVNLFLNPTESCCESELLFDNIEKARDCFVTHVKNNSRIVIVVDTDVDGNTSASVAYQYIKRINPEITIDYVIHNGKEHGLDDKSMTAISNGKYDLVIIPDAGSNDFSQLKTLHKSGLDVIILDHHLADKYSDDAITVNNQMSNTITDKAMTGVGIVYKFCKVLDEYYKVSYADDYLDLVAVGMIADSCDLRNLQSRYLVHQGLKQIAEKTNKNKFISELVNAQAYSMNNKVTIIGVAFYISPLINSLIRIGGQDDKTAMFKAFINSDEIVKTKIRGKGEVEVSIQEYARRLCESSKRKQKKIVDDSVSLMETQINQYNLDKLAVMVCNATTDIEKNYTGLIANKIASIYQRPCLLLRNNKGYCSGSGRGFDKSDIKNFNQWCLDTGLFKFAEGHEQAFGCSLLESNVDKLYNVISEIPYSNDLVYDVDAKFNDKTLNKAIMEVIAKQDDIWGTTVNEPIFAFENIVINKSDINLMGKTENTIKFIFHNIDFIKFNTNKAEYENIISLGDSVKFTIIGRCSLNEYNGTSTVQILINDMMYEKAMKTNKFRF